MKVIVVREICRFIYRPNLPSRSVYVGMICLSQVPLMRGDHTVALHLVDCYLSIFESYVALDGKDVTKGGSNDRRKKKGGKNGKVASNDNNMADSKLKLLSVLLSGVNKTFPFLKDYSSLYRHIDALFRLVHENNFSTSTQALVLISNMAIPIDTKSKGKSDAQIRRDKQRKAKDDLLASSSSSMSEDDRLVVVNEAKKDLSTRFYRALYSQLLSDQIISRSKNVMFLNLLYRSMKNDSNDTRTIAFLKRLLICSTHSAPHIAAGLIFLAAEVIKHKPFLLELILKEESQEFQGVDESKSLSGSAAEGSISFGNYDPNKREPSFSVSGNLGLWELPLFRHHYHPSVQSFANSLMSDPHKIDYDGDPTIDFSLTSFLERFSYKNPKQRQFKSRHLSEVPINNADFIASDPRSVAPDKVFFHKFFASRERLLSEGKSKSRLKKKEKDENFDEEYYDSDGGGVDKEREEREIDAFADKLAMNMLRASEGGNQDLEFAYSSPDDDDDDEEEEEEDESVYGNRDENFEIDDDDDSGRLEISDDEMIRNSGVDADNDDDDSYDGHEYEMNDEESNFDDGEEDVDEDGSVPYHSEIDAMELAAFVKNMKSKTDRKKEKRESINSVNVASGKRKRVDAESDFAAAEDYEEMMEEVVSKAIKR